MIQLWPASPSCLIHADADRDFLAADPATRQLLFLQSEADDSRPPVIERRAVETGRLVSLTPLHWKDVTTEVKRLVAAGGQASGPRFEISADGGSLYWSQMIAARDDTQSLSRGAVFDTKTGRRRGPTFPVFIAGHVAWSWDGRWIMLNRPESADHLTILDTWSGQPLLELAPPDRSASPAGCFSPDGQRALVQWGADPTLHQVNLASRSIERTHRLADARPTETDSEWQTVAEWRPGELRTHLTSVPPGNDPVLLMVVSDSRLPPPV